MAAPQPTTDQLHYSAEELLSSQDFKQPLVANGVRCHGGFDEDGVYRSPRTLFRGPAIAAWQNQLTRDGHELFDRESIVSALVRRACKASSAFLRTCI